MSFSRRAILSHYRLVERIGKGGWAWCGKPVDTRLDREIASSSSARRAGRRSPGGSPLPVRGEDRPPR